MNKRMELLGVVKRGDSEKGFWTRIGVAFQNRDGSWNLKFDYLPTSGETTIQMREPKDRDEDPRKRTESNKREDDEIPF